MNPMMRWKLGDVVATRYGVGVIVSYRKPKNPKKDFNNQSSSTSSSSSSDKEKGTNNKNERANHTSNDVVANHDDKKDHDIIANELVQDGTILFYVIRLWRIPYHSISSAAVAYLHSDCVSYAFVYFLLFWLLMGLMGFSIVC
jgi:hypothetical protein